MSGIQHGSLKGLHVSPSMAVIQICTSAESGLTFPVFLLWSYVQTAETTLVTSLNANCLLYFLLLSS